MQEGRSVGQYQVQITIMAQLIAQGLKATCRGTLSIFTTPITRSLGL